MAVMCICFQWRRVHHNAHYVTYVQMPGCPFCYIIIMFMMDPVGPMVQRNKLLLNHKCRHFASPCRAVYCQGLKVFQFFVLGRRKTSNVSAWLSRRIQAKVGIALAMKTA